MYEVFLGDTQFPVAPEAIKTKIKNQNETVTLINEGEINLLKAAGLTEITVELLLPQVQSYSFARYPNGFQPASYYLGILEKLKVGKEPFQFIVSRSYGRTTLYDTDLSVSLEDYTIKEDKSDGADIRVEVTLKQYQEAATKVLTVTTNDDGSKTATVEQSRATVGKKQEMSYTVQNGDTLSYIARKHLQDSGCYTKLYTLNKEVIEAAAKAHGQDSSKNGTLLYPGTVLQLPDSEGGRAWSLPS